MNMIRFLERITRDAATEGGAGATSDGGGATPADAGAQPNAGAGSPGAGQAEQPQAGPAFRPDGLPDHLYGATEKETIEKLWKAHAGAREFIGKFGEVPKDPTGYAFEPVDAIKPYVENLDKDPLFEKIRASAHKSGVPAKVFNSFLNDVMAEMVAGDMVQPPFNPEKERAALAPDVADPAERAKAADRIVRENVALLDAWKAQGLPEAVHTGLTSNLDYAWANQLVRYMAGLKNETPPALGGENGGALTKAALDARVADARNTVGNPKYDPAFAAETTRQFKAFYGDGPNAG
jgi:hypothetical protein